jgi:hypothetical protein
VNSEVSSINLKRCNHPKKFTVANFIRFPYFYYENCTPGYIFMIRNLFEYHPVTGYRFIPNIHARVRHENGGYFVHCNEMGFRCSHEFSKNKPENTFRILLFGDSYTAGDGVSNKDRFSDRLEQKISGISILNFGLPASGVDQQYLAFREFAKDIEYDLLIINPMADNIRRNLLTHHLIHSVFDGKLVLRPKPYFQLENNQLVLHHSPVPKEVKKYDNSVPQADHKKKSIIHRGLRHLTRTTDKKVPGFKGLTQRLRRLALPLEYNDPQHQGWLLMKAILTQWTKESSVPVIYCPFPIFDHISGNIRAEPYQRRFEELSQELNVEFVDILPKLLKEKRSTRAQCRFPIDEHPTPLCHSLVAEVLEPYVNKYFKQWKNK